MSGTVRLEVELALPPGAALDAVVDALGQALSRSGLDLDAAVTAREPGERLRLAWRPADWEADRRAEVELRAAAAGVGARVSLELWGLPALVGDAGGELAGWWGGEAAAALLLALTPGRFGDWVTDRRARRPSGPQARDVYRDPLFHRPNFLALLEVLDLGPEDRLLDVGCGGGALLEEALRSGCRAAGVDHSADMVRVARDLNRAAVAAGRAEIVEASAERLPFADASFTAAVSSGVLGFLRDPVAALAEIHRVLAPGGRLALFVGTAALRGTPAAPEPIAARLRFYDADELAALARTAGFADVAVAEPDLEPHARRAGVPEEAIGLFAAGGGPPRSLLLRATRG